MRLLIASGLVSPIEISNQVLADEKAMGLLHSVTSQMVCLGWSPTLGEIESLTMCERICLLRARSAYDAENAARIGLSTQGISGMALAVEPADGGNMRDDLAISVGLEGALKRARTMEPEKS